ncbi:MAG: glycosyltransferase family 39 protein [Armatimonadota bacterium]
MENNKNNKSYIAILTMVIALALILRYFKADTMNLWLDEAFGYWLSLQPLSNILKYIYNMDAHPPLFYFFLHFWVKAGHNPLTLRLPGIILGSLSLIGVYLLGKELINKQAGLIAAFMTAVSVSCVMMSREIRMYVYLSFFIIFAFYFFVKLFDRREVPESEYNPKPIYWFLYMICMVASWYLHYLGIFVSVSHNIIVALFYRRINIRHWILSQLIILICYIPWYKYLFYQIFCSRGPQEATFGWNAILYIWDLLFSSSMLLYPDKYNMWFVFIISALCLLILILSIVNYRKDRFFLAVVFIGFYTPFLILYFKSLLTSQTIFQLRYFNYALPLYFLIVVSSFVTKKKINTFLAFIIIGSFLVFNAAGLYNKYYVKGFQVQRWTEAVEYLQEHYNSNDAIIIQSSFQAMPFNYYFRQKHTEYYLTGKDVPELKGILAKHGRIWMVMSFAWQSDSENRIAKWLYENCEWEAVRYKNFTQSDADIIVILFTPKK